MKRQTEDATWMGVAEVIAERSKCEVKVGSVIISAEGRVLASGYNGSPAGYSESTEKTYCGGSCDRPGKVVKEPDYSDCPALHSELNSLLHSDVTRRKGGTIYITKPPCVSCAKAVANSGLSRVVIPRNSTSKSRNIQEAVDFLEKCGIQVERF